METRHNAQKNSAILVLRVFSAFLIVLCHIIAYYTFVPGSQILGQVFNVGVEVFFLISGFLYGGKTIESFGRWICKRWGKICIPIIILVLLDVFAMAIVGERTSALAVAAYLLNLQGLGFISGKVFPLMTIANLGPLWFATIIMICYVPIPVFQFFRDRINKSRHPKHIHTLVLVILIAISFFLYVYTEFDVQFFSVYLIGYVLGAVEFNEDNMTVIEYTGVTIVMLLAQILRLKLHTLIDGTSIYTASVGITQAMFGLWLFVSAFALKKYAPIFVENVSKAKFMLWLDSKSIYIYLTHCLFCTGTAFNVYIAIENIWVATLVFIACTTMAVVLLSVLSEYAIRLVGRH